MKLRPSASTALPLLGALAIAACSDSPLTPPATQAHAPTLSVGEAPGEQQIPEYVAGQIVVRYRDGEDAEVVSARHGRKLKQRLRLERTMLVEVPEGTEAAAAAELAQAPDVEFAEPDFLYAIVPCEVGNCNAPAENFMGYKWDLHNNGSITAGTSVLGATGAVDADIDWQEMYDALGPSFSGSAVIGILDTGIRPTHGDLSGRILAARGFATGYPSTFITDDDGHGTHVAGIAAARGNNNFGLAGVAYGANIKLLNAKVCAKYLIADSIKTSCPSSSTADGIIWAVDNGANVLNMSLGGDPRATAGSALQRAALQYAISRNVLPVCAAGNDNYPAIAFPARFPECMAVGATNWSDKRASYSNYGPELEISAPGGDGNPLGTAYSLILSASSTSDGGYVWKAGTSMATPQVVGLAAMLYATGMKNVNDVRARLKNTADDLGAPGWDAQFGAGRINAYRAITGKDPYAPPVVVAGGGYGALEGSPVSFDGSASFDPNNHPITFSWLFGDGSAAAKIAKPVHTFADNGAYSVALTVTDESNRATTVTTTATIVNVAPTVSMSLGAASILSGGSVDLSGSFSDPGVLDSPWSYAIDWGNGTTTGPALATQSAAISATRRFCAARDYPVRLTVTDKDGGAGSADAWVAVRRNEIAISAPDAVNSGALGRLPVTIFGSASFDAAAVDAATATLGNGVGAGVPVVRKSNGTLQMSVGDLNGDGRPDMVLHFDRAALAQSGALSADATQLVLLATMADGCVQVAGAAPIKVVP